MWPRLTGSGPEVEWQDLQAQGACALRLKKHFRDQGRIFGGCVCVCLTYFSKACIGIWQNDQSVSILPVQTKNTNVLFVKQA